MSWVRVPPAQLPSQDCSAVAQWESAVKPSGHNFVDRVFQANTVHHYRFQIKPNAALHSSPTSLGECNAAPRHTRLPVRST